MNFNEQSIVITGAGGMLGHSLSSLLQGRGCTPISLDRAALDICDNAALQRAFETHRPALLLNCAAHTKVDLCEAEPDKADAINGHAVGAMARLCRAFDTVMVHISTDFVFDGNSPRPFRPEDPVHPINAYGRSKLLGETLLQKEPPPRWLIARTAWVYGRHGVNFPRTMVQAARAAKPLKVVSDQRGSPTYSDDLAAAILDLLQKKAHGIFHITNGGETTWLEFAQATLRQWGIESPVAPISSAEWAALRPTAAQRPGYSGLDLSQTEALLQRPMRPWRAALADYHAAVVAGGF